MKLLINDKEIINFLNSLIGFTKEVEDIQLSEVNTAAIVEWISSLKNTKKFEKRFPKFKDNIEEAVSQDLRDFVNQIKIAIKNKKQSSADIIKHKVENIINAIGEETILEEYKKSTIQNYVKSIGLAIDKNATLVRRKDFNNIDDDCVIRNTVGNENFLVRKIDDAKPFWFIDSGYTNFLGKQKIWHRLVRNHLHFSSKFSAPVDRLGIFDKFPHQWRSSGDRILVIEPGEFAAAIFHVDIKQWKYNVESELRNYTDKKIVFREKAPKKKRDPLYQHLFDEDYYCVVNINSNAATESIWAGIPAITLDRHITNSVTKNKLSEINNLYTGPLAEWLAMLSYSQFTFDELIDGTALEIIKKYHG
jgi:hypothetical protein